MENVENIKINRNNKANENLKNKESKKNKENRKNNEHSNKFENSEFDKYILVSYIIIFKNSLIFFYLFKDKLGYIFFYIFRLILLVFGAFCLYFLDILNYEIIDYLLIITPIIFLIYLIVKKDISNKGIKLILLVFY